MGIETPRKPGLLFVARFLAALIVFYVVGALGPVNDHVVVPFTELVVSATAFLLRSVHQPIDVVGTVIRSPRFALDVRNGCNGVEAVMVLAAAMLAFPATFRSRLAGLLAGSVAIQILNLVRVSLSGLARRASSRIFRFRARRRLAVDRDSGSGLDVRLLELEVCGKTSRDSFLRERSVS